MALTITAPDEYSAAYNPIVVEAVSTVRDDFTTGMEDTIDSITSNSGFVQLTLGSGSNTYLKGDYMLITSAPGAETLEGVALITEVVTTDVYVINKAFTTGLSAVGAVYKYISNYSMLLKFYIYVTSAPSTAVLVATKTLKPKFSGGFCVFNADLSGLIQSYNYEGTDPDDVMNSDIYIGAGALQINNKSFVKYGFECFEAFDNPVGGTPVYEQEVEA